MVGRGRGGETYGGCGWGFVVLGRNVRVALGWGLSGGKTVGLNDKNRESNNNKQIVPSPESGLVCLGNL